MKCLKNNERMIHWLEKPTLIFKYLPKINSLYFCLIYNIINFKHFSRKKVVALQVVALLVEEPTLTPTAHIPATLLGIQGLLKYLVNSNIC